MKRKVISYLLLVIILLQICSISGVSELKVVASTDMSLDGKIFYITSTSDYYTLFAEAGNSDEDSREVYVSHNYEKSCTQWKFYYDENKAAYKILLASNEDICLGVRIDTCSSYVTVRTCSSDSTSNTRYWFVEKYEDGTYKLKPKYYPSKVLTVMQDNSVTAGINTAYYTNDWYLNEANIHNKVIGFYQPLYEPKITHTGYQNSALKYYEMGYYLYKNDQTAIDSYLKENGTSHLSAFDVSSLVGYQIKSTTTIDDVLNLMDQRTTSIVFFDTHCDNSKMILRDGVKGGASGLMLTTSHITGKFGVSSNALSNLRLVVFAGCGSARPAIDLGDVCVNAGAQTAIAFNGIQNPNGTDEYGASYIIYDSDINYWEERFAFYCNLGYSIQGACAMANGDVTAYLSQQYKEGKIEEARGSSLYPCLYGNKYQRLKD